ncbi:MAG: GNAT family N-acetyltransferase [Kineothrix sp.]
MKRDFLIRRAGPEDAASIHRIMVEAAEALEDKDLYVCDDLAYVEQHIQDSGFAVAACDADGKIVAGLILRYPGSAEDNLGYDIGLPLAELGKVVHMESAVVLPAYRGNHLQEKMLRYAEELIDKSVYSYFMATVSPDNPASRICLERNGYRHVATREKYGGLIRHICLKKAVPVKIIVNSCKS